MIIEKIKAGKLPKGVYRGYSASLLSLEEAIAEFIKTNGYEPTTIFEVTCTCHNATTYYILDGREDDETLPTT